MRAVPLILILLVARAGVRPAAAAESGDRRLADQPVSRRRPVGHRDHRGDGAVDRRRHQPRARAQPRRADRRAGGRRARGARWIALSELLPNINGRVSETRQMINLAVFGFPLPPAGAVDRRTVQRVRRAGLRHAADHRPARDQRCARRGAQRRGRALPTRARAISSSWSPPTLYLQALAASARADSARAQMDTAQALYNQAVDLKQSGLVAGIDVLRAQVQLNTEQQRATATRQRFREGQAAARARSSACRSARPFTLDGRASRMRRCPT